LLFSAIKKRNRLNFFTLIFRYVYRLNNYLGYVMPPAHI